MTKIDFYLTNLIFYIVACVLAVWAKEFESLASFASSVIHAKLPGVSVASYIYS